MKFNTKVQKYMQGTHRTEAAEYTKVHADKVVCHADGTATVKKYYFYTHGQTARAWGEKVVEELRRAGFGVQLVKVSNNYNNWPKDSYFEATVAPNEFENANPTSIIEITGQK